MTDRAITIALPDSPLLPADAYGAAKSRLKSYVAWLSSAGQAWYFPDLPGYVEHLRRRGIAETTIAAHLSTVKERYRQVTLDRDQFFEMFPDGTFLERQAMVDEVITRIKNALDVKIDLNITVKQDESDLTHIRLTKDQADSLLRQPGLSTLQGVRNTAIIALMLCTGIREQELCDLDVDDLEQRLSGELSLRVAHGKGNKQRLVPYGELVWCLAFVYHWMRLAGIHEGAVFRRVRKNNRVGTEQLTTRSVQMIMSKYRVIHDRRVVAPRPHDLRRTYARRLWEDNVDPIRIQQNLGHADLKTTLRYIGALDGKQRRPPAIYNLPADLLAMIEE